MLQNGQAGIDCENCGHQEIVTTKPESKALTEALHWVDDGDPICSECLEVVMYEDYIDE